MVTGNGAGRKDGRGVFVLAAAVAVLVLAAPCTGWMAARVAQAFTHDARTVVRVVLAAVWVAETVLFAVFAAMLIRRRMRILRWAGVAEQECEVARLRLKSRYVLTGVLWAAALGYACFGVFRSLEQNGVFSGEGGVFSF